MSAPHTSKHDFIPSREADLLNWSRSFNAQINTPPGPGAYGISVLQASQYTVLHDAYAAAYAIAKDSRTNSKSSVMVKNEAKAALKADARMLARIVRATPTVSNGQRIALGLTVPDTDLTPVNRPSDPPVVSIMSSLGRRVKIRLRDKAARDRLGKPPGTLGAAVFVYVASPDETNPPENLSRWSFQGNAMRRFFNVSFDGDAPAGAKAWITAAWFSTRGKLGPVGTAASVRINEGLSGLSMAA